ncbi:hypothetical protein ACNKHK_20430 [Shigella flexneri]
MAARLGADALTSPPPRHAGVCRRALLHVRRHVSVQASATDEEAINFYPSRL